MSLDEPETFIPIIINIAFFSNTLYNNDMPLDKKKIGLVLASIHTGMSRNMWAGFVRTAALEDTSLFIFPGGMLNDRHDFENLRNSVYNLVNDENLDGCISWSSTIRYTQSQEEFEFFHSGFGPLPCVTLSFKLPGLSCIEFDAYSGMKDLVNHFINVHGAKKIAFLRGPDFHRSAASRFEGYCDALRDAGLASQTKGSSFFLSPLVTDHFGWDAGEAAASQLFEQRALIPGKDFDTLIGSSDLMALGAINYFEKKGFHVPKDYHAAGFNNSAESRVTKSLLTTVHLPYDQMSSEAFKKLLSFLGKKRRKPDSDIILQCDLIIRESCGCAVGTDCGAYPHNEPKKIQFLDFSKNNIEETLVNMAAAYMKLETEQIDNFVQPVIHALLHEPREIFFGVFEKALVSFFEANLETDNLLKFISDVKANAFNLSKNISKIEGLLYRSIFNVREQLTAHARHETARLNSVLNSLKCDLLGTRDRFSLVQNLARHLPKIGINTTAIVLYSDEKTSVFAGGFSCEGINPVREQRFPSRLLVPPMLKHQFSDGIFMVQPLFIDNRSLGYFIHNAPITDGVIFEELRSAISYALKGIFLLEETVQAKRIAEQAERAKTEFFQVLENGLFNPLQGVTDQLEAIEKKASNGGYLPLLKDIKKIKDFVSSKEVEANSVMDFTMAMVDELSVHKTVFDISEILPNIGTFPLLVGDTARLAQCFSLIREQYCPAQYYEKDFLSELTYTGLSLTFFGKAGGNLSEPSLKGSGPGGGSGSGVNIGKLNISEKARHFSLLLAERIILMHGGTFSAEHDRCSVTLPWPTLTGNELSKNPVGPKDQVLVISDPDSLPANFFDLPQVWDIEKAIPGKTAFIAWNAAGASSGELIKVSAMKSKLEFSGVPFLCYGMPSTAAGAVDSAASLIDIIDFALKSPKKGTILFIGSQEYWSDFSGEIISPDNESRQEYGIEKIRIDSMSVFNRTVGEVSPQLIIFNSLDVEGASAVRRHPLTVMVPIMMISDRIDNAAEVLALSQYSRLIICHKAAVSSPEFKARIQAVICGAEILPPHTGVLVKKAILYFGVHAESHISRWKLADSVNVSEDYLTRIFHREMGLSLWDYLSRLRIFLAANLLRSTDDTIQDIAYRTGFQDHAYFCRVFKKIYGVPPGQLRKQ